MSPWMLILLGLFLIYLEFFLPGAVLGVCGGIFVLASVIVFAEHSQSLAAVLGFVVFALAAVGVVVKLAIWRIRTAKPGRSIYSDDSQVGYVASEYDHRAVGKIGIAATDLKPGGYVVVDGKRQQAISQAGYITKGTEIVVVSGQEESLIVKINKQKEHQCL